jgi:predicted ATPase
MMGVDGNRLQEALSQLVNSELLYSRGNEPDLTYVFRHTLLQETVYSSLLRPRRQGYHKAAATTLERLRPGVIERTPEMLAHHWMNAGNPAKAYPYAMSAGEKALARYANTEARVRFSEAAEAAAVWSAHGS